MDDAPYDKNALPYSINIIDAMKSIHNSDRNTRFAIEYLRNKLHEDTFNKFRSSIENPGYFISFYGNKVSWFFGHYNPNYHRFCFYETDGKQYWHRHNEYPNISIAFARFGRDMNGNIICYVPDLAMINIDKIYLPNSDYSITIRKTSQILSVNLSVPDDPHPFVDTSLSPVPLRVEVDESPSAVSFRSPTPPTVDALANSNWWGDLEDGDMFDGGRR